MWDMVLTRTAQVARHVLACGDSIMGISSDSLGRTYDHNHRQSAQGKADANVMDAHCDAIQRQPHVKNGDA
jgi:hypothetical protein